MTTPTAHPPVASEVCTVRHSDSRTFRSPTRDSTSSHLPCTRRDYPRRGGASWKGKDRVAVLPEKVVSSTFTSTPDSVVRSGTVHGPRQRATVQ